MRKWFFRCLDKQLYLNLIAREQLYEQLYSLCSALKTAHNPSYSVEVSNRLDEAEKLLLILRGANV